MRRFSSLLLFILLLCASYGLGKGPPFETTTLLPNFKNEELGQSNAFPGRYVIYFNEDTRKKYQVEMKEGKLYWPSGKLINTSPDKMIFVMNENGQIYLGPSRDYIFHHSSFLAGGPVAAAGEMEVVNGVIVKLEEKSGHYKPDKKYFDQFLEYLKDNAIVPMRTEYIFRAEPSKQADSKWGKPDKEPNFIRRICNGIISKISAQ